MSQHPTAARREACGVNRLVTASFATGGVSRANAWCPTPGALPQMPLRHRMHEKTVHPVRFDDAQLPHPVKPAGAGITSRQRPVHKPSPTCGGDATAAKAVHVSGSCRCRWAEEHDVVLGGDEVARAQMRDQAAGVLHVELLQRLVRRELRRSDAAFTTVGLAG